MTITHRLLWCSLEGSSPSVSSKRLRLVEVLRSLAKDKKLDRKQAMTLFDHDCMHAVGLVADKAQLDGFKRQEVRHNTKVSYTQAKYNLLREDSEGYSKLIAALNHFSLGSIAHRSQSLKSDPSARLVDAMDVSDASSVGNGVEAICRLLFEEVKALIGYYDLDPNRALDLILEAAEQQESSALSADCLLSLLPLFKAEAVVHLLGFRFRFYHKQEAGPTPSSLFTLTARCVSLPHKHHLSFPLTHLHSISS
jgi:THO complex subunit 2